MRAAALALSLLLAASPLAGQVRNGPLTRGPTRSGPAPWMNPPPRMPQAERLGQPITPGPVPLPSPHHSWIRLETQNFTIFSSAGARTTRRIALDLERLTTLLLSMSPHFRIPAARTRVFLFGDSRDVRPYLDVARGMRADAAGVTLRHPDGSTILVDCTARGGGDLTPRHELVHDLVRNHERPLPLWLEEGLAEYYSSAGLPVQEHISRVRLARLRLPLEELFAIRADSPRAATWDFYAESWAAVAALLTRDRSAFQAFVASLGAGMPVDAALREHYAFTPQDLQNAMRRTGKPARSVLSSGVDLAVAPVPVDYPELVFELGEFLLRLPGRIADAEQHFREARPYLESAPLERTDIAFALFALCVREGRHDQTEILFSRLADSPRGLVTRKFLLDAGQDRAEELASEGKLLEAAQVLRELARKMPEKARLGLEARAALLEARAGQ